MSDVASDPPADLSDRGLADLSTWRGRAGAWLDLMLVDHGVLRLFYRNVHALSPTMQRAAQPSPGDIARFARKGVKTIVNLRGRGSTGRYALQREACARHGIRLVDFKLSSRRPMRREAILAARELFRTIDYPAVLHCKSGADRAGIMSVLYLLAECGASVEEARRQLSLRFGHVRSGPTGMLDHIFEVYLAEGAGLDFWTWVETRYDEAAVAASFRSGRLGTFLVDRVLRRE